MFYSAKFKTPFGCTDYIHSSVICLHHPKFKLFFIFVRDLNSVLCLPPVFTKVAGTLREAMICYDVAKSEGGLAYSYYFLFFIMKENLVLSQILKLNELLRIERRHFFAPTDFCLIEVIVEFRSVHGLHAPWAVETIFQQEYSYH
jgi:hypothetical protein